MFCLKCGMQMPDSATKCPQCGGALNLPEPPVQPVVAPGAQPEEAARMLHLNSLFTLFRSGIVKALMIWEIVGAVLSVLLCLLSIRALPLMPIVLGLAAAKCLIAYGLRTVHHATFADEARRGCRQVRLGLYILTAVTVLLVVYILVIIFLLSPLINAVADGFVVQAVRTPNAWGVVLMILLTVIGCAPYLLEAEVLRRCSYNLWVLSDPTVSRQYIQVGGLVTAVVVAVSAVISLFSGEFSLFSLVPLVAQVIVALIAFEFYKISKAARVAPEDTAE